MEQRIFNTLISTKFKRGFYWNLWGSVVYETIKAAHHFFLLQIVTPFSYGLITSTMASIYFITKIADTGATPSLPPFFRLITKNTANFKYFLTNFYAVPHLLIMIAPAWIGANFYLQKVLLHYGNFIVVGFCVLVFLEVIRTFLRLFLHISFSNKATVITEITIFSLYIITIWILYFCFNTPITLTLILKLHLIESSLGVVSFIILLRRYYQTLPQNTLAIPEGMPGRMLRTKSYGYLLRLSRDLFTTHFLTPLFAIKFGLVQAGIFYVAAVIANATQAVFKMSFDYAGRALLANIKEFPPAIKKQAFSLLSRKLSMVTIPLIIFFLINHKSIISITNNTAKSVLSSETIAMFFLYLIIVFSEFFFVLYEQFYNMEEGTLRILIFKIIEFLFFYILVIANSTITQFTALLTIIGIRAASFVIIAIDAYWRWHIFPSFKIDAKFIAVIVTSFIGSIVALFFF